MWQTPRFALDLEARPFNVTFVCMSLSGASTARPLSPPPEQQRQQRKDDADHDASPEWEVEDHVLATPDEIAGQAPRANTESRSQRDQQAGADQHASNQDESSADGDHAVLQLSP